MGGPRLGFRMAAPTSSLIIRLGSRPAEGIGTKLDVYFGCIIFYYRCCNALYMLYYTIFLFCFSKKAYVVLRKARKFSKQSVRQGLLKRTGRFSVCRVIATSWDSPNKNRQRRLDFVGASLGSSESGACCEPSLQDAGGQSTALEIFWLICDM